MSKDRKMKPLSVSRREKRSDRIESEKRIITAALSVFAKKGFEGSSVHEIAKKSGVNVSLIHRYFDGKEGVLLAIFETSLVEMDQRKHDYPPQDSVFDELFEFAKAEHKQFEGQISKYRILCGQAIVNGTFRKKLMASLERYQDDKFLSSRLELLKLKNLLASDVNVFETQLFFSYQLFGLIVLNRIILDIAPREEDLVVKDFVKRFANSL